MRERPISWNTYYSGKHWSERKAEADRVHMLVRSEIDPEWQMFEVPVNIDVSVWFDSRPQDASNICAKVYEDALVGWLIQDDGPDYVASVRTASYVDKRNPRVEITLSPAVAPF